ncbi:MAG: SMC-Scp complex subunit ScpB [Defluviitaleaceae bacterium]|nr:SMC-Scp complex subunit ScpB [Defluviitaleaceae bacterium]
MSSILEPTEVAISEAVGIVNTLDITTATSIFEPTKIAISEAVEIVSTSDITSATSVLEPAKIAISEAVGIVNTLDITAATSILEPAQVAFSQAVGTSDITAASAFEPAQAAIEAILFVSSEAVGILDIAAAIGVQKKEATEIVHGLMKKYKDEKRGIEIIAVEDAFQMRTAPHTAEFLRRHFAPKREINLSASLLETLSIIAFEQPVTKVEIEAIRGVNADHGTNRLLEFGLIEEVGRANSPGKPILFGTTPEFLKHYGLTSLGELRSLFNS